MMDIKLESKKLKVVEVKSKTQAKLFKDLKVGDVIKINTEIGLGVKNTGINKTSLTIKNLNTGEEVDRTVREVVLVTLNFEFEEVQE